MIRQAGILSGLCVAITCVTASAADKPDPQGIAFFEKKIRPVLTKYCYQCHSAQTKKPKGDLLLDTKAGTLKGGETGHAVVPGNLKDSLLIAAIRHTGDVSEMPPKQKLPDAVIADFERWVKMGAPDPRDGKKKIFGPRKIDFNEARRFWAFIPPKQAKLPPLKNAAWPRNGIDRYLLAKMETRKVTPVRDADRSTLIRRATFDLTGLPPTPAEIDAFLKDSSPNAFEKVVDRLLKSPQFGERWGRHWLDVVRYAESTGKERNYAYPNAWRYRNWVIDSFNKDKPYDQFIREQIAGDLLPAKTPQQADDQLLGTGFLALGPKSLNERNRLKFEMDVVDDQIDATGRAILGMTIACARCHDHKFDPIPTKDYYAIAGIFRSTNVVSGVRGRRGVRNGGNTGGIPLKTGAGGQKRAQYDAKMKVLQQQFNRGFNRLAKTARGKAGKKKRRKLNKKQLQRLKQRLQIPPVRNNDTPEIATLKREMQKVAAQIKRLRKTAPPAAAVAMGVQDGNRAVESRIFIKGEVDDQGEVVPRGFLTVTKRDDDPKIASGSGRLELARWLTAKRNPLTARVMANRVWQHLMGTGLVKTVDNFGLTGERPVNPELLDHLALRFMQQNWSVKSLVRDIVTSRAYGLASDHHEGNYTIDPDNRLAWRGGRRRLDAEAIRDAMLAAGGQLDRERPKSSPIAGLGQGELGRQVSLRDMSASNVRSVYLPIVRQAMPEMMRVFDVADPSLIVGSRDITTVPTQALFMMNSPFVMRQAEAMAGHLLAEKGMNDAARIRHAYRLTLSREPTKQETDRVASFLAQYRKMMDKKGKSDAELQGWTAFCQTLFASAEFRYLY